MDLQIAKWGNSLAVRIPAEVVRRLGLREGATVQAQLTADGSFTLRAERFDRKAFAAELAVLRAAAPVGEPAVPQLRDEARY
jgi:antitoxin MazE